MRVDAVPRPGRRDSGASPPRRGGRVTDRAVAFDVTADAGADVSFCFPGVVAGRARAVRPLRFRRMKAAAIGGVRKRPRHGDAGALMAGQAKGLLAVAARAFLLVFARRDGMHRDEVVRVHIARTHAAVVTIGAILFAVAIAAEAAVVAGDEFVPIQPIRTVARIMEPSRRRERAGVEAHLQHAGRFGQVASAAIRARFAGRR